MDNPTGNQDWQPPLEPMPRVGTTKRTVLHILYLLLSFPLGLFYFVFLVTGITVGITIGNQWGMMNETGRYPGQTWLWLYTMWYQVPPFTSSTGFLGINSSNADLGIIILMTVLTGALAVVPFIPILRDIPRWVPIHRLIWRDYYAPKRKSA